MAANKVVFGNKVLIDLTGDTVTEEQMVQLLPERLSQDILTSSCS